MKTISNINQRNSFVQLTMTWTTFDRSK